MIILKVDKLLFHKKFVHVSLINIFQNSLKILHNIDLILIILAIFIDHVIISDLRSVCICESIFKQTWTHWVGVILSKVLKTGLGSTITLAIDSSFNSEFILRNGGKFAYLFPHQLQQKTQSHFTHLGSFRVTFQEEVVFLYRLGLLSQMAFFPHTSTLQGVKSFPVFEAHSLHLAQKTSKTETLFAVGALFGKAVNIKRFPHLDVRRMLGWMLSTDGSTYCCLTKLAIPHPLLDILNTDRWHVQESFHECYLGHIGYIVLNAQKYTFILLKSKRQNSYLWKNKLYSLLQ